MNKDAIQEATKKLAIKMVYLGGSETKLCNGFDPLEPNQELIGQFRIGTELVDVKEVADNNSNQKYLRFHVAAGMRYLKGPIAEEIEEDLIEELVVSEITALFVAEYTVLDNEELSEECVNEFGRVNAPFNVWPYWREFCQSTCSRMSLPVTVIPMLKID